MEKLKFNELQLNLVRRKLLIAGCVVNLRNKEFSLLYYFMNNMGKVISRTQLLEEVWDHNICCATNTVDVHVNTLRNKFKKFAGRDFIRTVHCIGYVFGE